MTTQLKRLQYILKKELFDKTSAAVFVAGGYITKYLQNEKPNDMDLFFSRRSDVARFIIDARNNLEFKHHYISKNLIRGTIAFRGEVIKIDVVKRFFRGEQDIIDNFDFTICCFCISVNKIVFHEDAPFDLLRKKLNINKVTFPAATMFRLQKYVKRDFSYCSGVVKQIMEKTKDKSVKIEDEIFYEDGTLSMNNFD